MQRGGKSSGPPIKLPPDDGDDNDELKHGMS